MVEESRKEIERFKHNFIAHPLMALSNILAHITQNTFFNELAEAIHESIGENKEEC